MKKVYEWKMDSFAKGIKPNKAVKELERIENIFGFLTADNILKASTDEDALFHTLFTWDDTEAANLYRLQQARQILNNIEVNVIYDGNPVKIGAYEVVKKDNGRVYKNIETFTPVDVEQVRLQAIRDITILKNKLSFYNDFSKATKKLESAVSLLQ